MAANDRRPHERDWKLYRSLLPGWQEAYMEKLEREYILLLASEAPASEKFWDLEERIRADKEKAGVIVYGDSRSKMFDRVLGLISCGAITVDDLKDFSDDFRGEVATYLDRSARLSK